MPTQNQSDQPGSLQIKPHSTSSRARYVVQRMDESTCSAYCSHCGKPHYGAEVPMKIGHIQSIWRYPVKGMAGVVLIGLGLATLFQCLEAALLLVMVSARGSSW